jgi:serine/threonine protein kinase
VLTNVCVCVCWQVADWPTLSDEENEERFHQEVSIMWSLSFHPNVIKLLGYSDSPTRSIITRLYPTDLFRYLHTQEDKSALESHLLLHLGSGMVASMAAVHSMGIAHRDIKTPNFLLQEPRPGSPFPDPILCDFGISRTRYAHTHTHTETDTHRDRHTETDTHTYTHIHTETDTHIQYTHTHIQYTHIQYTHTLSLPLSLSLFFCGLLHGLTRLCLCGSDETSKFISVRGYSPRYAPPEVFARVHLRASSNTIDDDKSSDIYSLGVVLWETTARMVRVVCVYMCVYEGGIVPLCASVPLCLCLCLCLGFLGLSMGGLACLYPPGAVGRCDQ